MQTYGCPLLYGAFLATFFDLAASLQVDLGSDDWVSRS